MSIDMSTTIPAGLKLNGANTSDWVEALPSTPGFVFDEQRLAHNLSLLDKIRSASACRVLYSIKACPFTGLLKRMRGQVDGFSVSSLFEARLAREALAGAGTLHITTPGLRREEMSEIGELCDYVSFNSLNQLERLPALLGDTASIGLRINPQLSFLADPRYDPCRLHSKLGAPLTQVAEGWRSGKLSARGISGLHLHTNFSSNSFAPLQRSVRHLQAHLPQLVHELEWVNLGGGYLFQASDDQETLLKTIEQIQTGWKAQVYLEPGKSLVGDAGFLIASVIDTFESDGKSIAVLDTSVNHLPEVFEYQKPPQLLCERADDACSVILAGATCLSGDLFGEYRFPRPLEIDDRVVFKNVGAYSLIKASRFNGLNLPSIHLLDEHGALSLLRAYGYEDYRQQWREAKPLQQTSKFGVG
jgi:carboxynorspermidine decarboxylase